MQGKSVRIFLVDGTPTGLVTAEIMNWTGHALLAPRSRLAEALSRDEAGRTGIYLLVGEDPDTPSRSMLYVGEADTVRTRLKDHAKDDRKDFWTHACIVTSKDRNLTKAHVRYLEGRLIDKARGAGRAVLANGTSPATDAFLPESDTSDMEYFLSQIEVVLPVVGIDLLRAPPTRARPSTQSNAQEGDTKTLGGTFIPTEIVELELSPAKHDYIARAFDMDGEFVVLKDSTAVAGPGNDANGYDRLRTQLIENGDLVPDPINPKLLKFKGDFTFKSASAAASVINGRSSNGRTDWRVKATGQTLKAYQDSLLNLVAGVDEGA